MLEKAIELIEAQQGEREQSPHLWMLGEQLKDICRHEPRSAELIAQDLESPQMSLRALLSKMDGLAQKNKRGSQSCVTPAEADALIREFFGLPKPGATEPLPVEPQPVPAAPSTGKVVSLFDLI